jgi:hypothetical protein
MKLLLKETGVDSFADYHFTRYWKYTFNKEVVNLKRHKHAYIVTYDNDLKENKGMYYVYIEWFGCIAPKEYKTPYFKAAVTFLNNNIRK